MKAGHHILPFLTGHLEQHGCPFSMDKEATGLGNHGLTSMIHICTASWLGTTRVFVWFPHQQRKN